MPILSITTPGSDDETYPCDDWCTWADVVACDEKLEDVGDTASRAAWIDAASTTLYKRSHRRYPGLCSRTVLVCGGGDRCDHWTSSLCACQPRSRVRLAPTPIRSIESVVVDGETLDPSAYRLVSRRYLDRIDGDRWPWGSTVDEDEFRVEFTYGRAPGADGQRAAAALAAEFAKDCAPGLTCQLPRRMRSMSRESGTYVLVAEDLERMMHGLFGIEAIDTFLISDAIDRQPRAALTDPYRHRGGLTRLP